jgi:hypothetical protein
MLASAEGTIENWGGIDQGVSVFIRRDRLLATMTCVIAATRIIKWQRSTE